MATLFDILQDEFFKNMAFMDGRSAAKFSKACPKCGCRYSDFDRTGHFGCATCYDTFLEYIEPLLERIQGTSSYKGRFPAHGHRLESSTEEITQLENMLRIAVEKQDFEKASILRDKILEHKKKRGIL